MVGAAHRIPLEAAAAVLEMAEVAWNALEHRRESKLEAAHEDAAAELRAENARLRTALHDNLALIQNLASSPGLALDCPPDLYERLVTAADSSSFLNKLDSLHQESVLTSNGTSFKESTEAKLGTVEIVINVDNEEPSWWVWVTKEMVPDNLEEASGIDNESYVIISEENVVDGIADFVAKCILANPKSKTLTPKELQKCVLRALGGIKEMSMLRKVWEAGKIIYTLSTWGIVLAGLYRHRAALKVAAKGVHHTSKLVMKAL